VWGGITFLGSALLLPASRLTARLDLFAVLSLFNELVLLRSPLIDDLVLRPFSSMALLMALPWRTHVILAAEVEAPSREQGERFAYEVVPAVREAVEKEHGETDAVRTIQARPQMK
jgi:hypothetical protein